MRLGSTGAEEEPCSFCRGAGISYHRPCRVFGYAETAPVAVQVDETGWLTCPNCEDRFNLGDPTHWTGLRHQLCGQKIDPRVDHNG
jgi:hypothetical protein